jgi:hypothetical protein
MPKANKPSTDRDGLPTTDHMDRLVAAYERIADEIKAIRETFDRLADDFTWALNNDKLKPEHFHNFCTLACDSADMHSPVRDDHIDRRDDESPEDIETKRTSQPANSPAPEQGQLW